MWVTVTTPFRWEGEPRQRAEVLQVAGQEARRLMSVNRVREAWMGPCTAETARCDASKSYVTPTPECCREHRRLLMRELAELFENEGVTWWVDYGTLLGAVRHQGMIPHDKDEDLGILGSDLGKLLLSKPELEAQGRWFMYRTASGGTFSGGNRVKVRVSRVNRTNVDIFPWYERKDGTLYRKAYVSVDRYKGRAFHRDLLFPLCELEWEGMKVPAPRDPEAFCRMRYGKGWRTPIRANHDGRRR